MQCPVLKDVKLKAEEVLRWKAVKDKVSQYDTAQQVAIASFQRRVEYGKGPGIEVMRAIELAAVEVPR